MGVEGGDDRDKMLVFRFKGSVLQLMLFISFHSVKYCYLKLHWEIFAAECEVATMRVRTFKSEVLGGLLLEVNKINSGFHLQVILTWSGRTTDKSVQYQTGDLDVDLIPDHCGEEGAEARGESS